jgi:hypothetical protein
LSSLLAKMSPLPIDASMAVLDPLLASSSGKYQPPSSPTNDVHGFSSYARGVYALLEFFSANRTLAKKSLWAVRHFIALSIYAHDFQSVPAHASPAFDERAFGSHGLAPSLSEVISRVDQMTTYLLISSTEGTGEEDWRKYAVDSLLNEKETPQSQAHALSRFVVQVVNEAKRSDLPRETRVLRLVLEHVLDDDMDTATGDLWIQLSRKLERSGMAYPLPV